MADQIRLIRPRRRLGASFVSTDDTGAELRSLAFDGTMSESYEKVVRYPEHPTDAGFVVSDHAILDPEKVSLEGVITRTPLWMTEANADPLHLEKTLAALDAIVVNKEVVTVSTGLRLYKKRNIGRCSVSRSPGGQIVKVSVELLDIRTVAAQSVEIPPLPVEETKKGAAAAEADAGTQAGTDKTGEEEDESIASAVFDFFGFGED